MHCKWGQRVNQSLVDLPWNCIVLTQHAVRCTFNSQILGSVTVTCSEAKTLSFTIDHWPSCNKDISEKSQHCSTLQSVLQLQLTPLQIQESKGFSPSVLANTWDKFWRSCNSCLLSTLYYDLFLEGMQYSIIVQDKKVCISILAN